MKTATSTTPNSKISRTGNTSASSMNDWPRGWGKRTRLMDNLTLTFSVSFLKIGQQQPRPGITLYRGLILQ
jgi:hypothetical protein